jgi:hypothetical protein
MLLGEVPELVPSARKIAEEQDDEPSLGELLEALAGLLAAVLAPGLEAGARSACREEGQTLGRWFGAVEALAADDDDDEARFFVGSAFLETLGPQARSRAAPWLGPATRTILADLEEGWPEEDHLAWDEDEDPGDIDDEDVPGPSWARPIGGGSPGEVEQPGRRGLRPGAWPDGRPRPLRCSERGPRPPPRR